MRIRNVAEDSDKIELQMTPMIDIVFQLLVFFVMTFKIVSLEADFDIKMPRSAPRQGNPPPGTPPMKLQLRANANGSLAGMYVGNKSFTGPAAFDELRAYIIDRFGGISSPSNPDDSPEVEIEFDEQLKYQWIVAAMDAISGYPTSSGEIVRLVEKIKFAPARRSASG